ncbi:hypothetical protein MUG78_17320 [Gordonia alkaliphila]|uniref:hypothetical protein n=1 Tax=Gordonia alkaliphila TaxID=1053547 RepID=UPI001FF62E80|nr:hypothetical protein [Gordonia alkaliphila]MCK0441162.1 hypothetical protein [Gordonia alkaliphila]
MSTEVTSVAIRVEVMPESENTGEVYVDKVEEIRVALEKQVTEFGLDALPNPAGQIVCEFRQEVVDLALKDSPTAQVQRWMETLYGVVFRNATRADVVEHMKTLDPRKPDGTPYAGVKWAFFDLAAFRES